MSVRLRRCLGLLAFLAIAVACARLGSQRALGQDNPDKADLLAAYREGDRLKQQGRYPEAIQQYEKAVALAPKVYGPDHLNTATLMNNLAFLYDAAGRYEESEKMHLRSLKIRETQLGKDHLDVAQSLNNLATLYYAMGRYDDAEPLMKRGLQIRQARLGKNHPLVADSLSNLGGLYNVTGRYEQAEELYQQGLEIREARFGKDSLDVATSLNSLALLNATLKRYEKAEPLYRRSLQIREDKLGRDHPVVALSLNNLAELYRVMGRYEQAEPLYKRSLEIREARLGKDHPDVAQSLSNLGLLYDDMNRLDKAEPLYQRSLQIREAKLGKNHPDVALNLNNLAALYHYTGRYEQAEPLYLRSLRINEARLGKDHPDVATGLNNLAELYRALGQFEQAEPLYRRCLAIRQARFGKEHPALATALNNLAQLYAATQRWAEAGAAFDRERHIRRQYLKRILPALAEPEQQALLRSWNDHLLHISLSLALARRDDVHLRELTAAWLLNGKAVAQQALAERTLLARDSADPNVKKLLPQLLRTRGQLAALTHQVPRPGQEAQRLQRLDELANHEQELTKEIGLLTGTPTRADPWVPLSEVRDVLPRDAMLIEIAKFQPFDFRAKGKESPWQEARYIAWVIPPRDRGDVQLIDLGAAAKIEAAVQAFRQTMTEAVGTPKKPGTLRTQGEPDSEKLLQKPLATLSRLVLQPLLPHTGKADRLLLSPDADLWLIPWAALPLADGKYAVETYQISYVISGRVLTNPVAENKPAAPVIFADPDYDLNPAQAGALAKKLLGTGAPVTGVRSVIPSGKLPAVPRLAFTALEAELIAPNLERYEQAKPQVHLGKEALEGVFKALQRPRTLVLSTHGFFLEDQRVASAARPEREGKQTVLTAEGKPLENPLLRCGLLLAGCNQRALAREGEDDGVLTGLEIVGTDLRGCELVVLSACETALGQVHTGEGVSGLRQAFQLAGAQSVVASLWQVPDRETAKLMSRFFANLADGRPKADALRLAQLELIRARRDRLGAAHPFFWAAFTFTGQRP
jgi:CHAT domain-containing protein/Tfp pilus assembly protein PilF